MSDAIRKCVPRGPETEFMRTHGPRIRAIEQSEKFGEIKAKVAVGPGILGAMIFTDEIDSLKRFRSSQWNAYLDEKKIPGDSLIRKSQFEKIPEPGTISIWLTNMNSEDIGKMTGAEIDDVSGVFIPPMMFLSDEQYYSVYANEYYRQHRQWLRPVYEPVQKVLSYGSPLPDFPAGTVFEPEGANRATAWTSFTATLEYDDKKKYCARYDVEGVCMRTGQPFMIRGINVDEQSDYGDAIWTPVSLSGEYMRTRHTRRVIPAPPIFVSTSPKSDVLKEEEKDRALAIEMQRRDYELFEQGVAIKDLPTRVPLSRHVLIGYHSTRHPMPTELDRFYGDDEDKTPPPPKRETGEGGGEDEENFHDPKQLSDADQLRINDISSENKSIRIKLININTLIDEKITLLQTLLDSVKGSHKKNVKNRIYILNSYKTRINGTTLPSRQNDPGIFALLNENEFMLKDIETSPQKYGDLQKALDSIAQYVHEVDKTVNDIMKNVQDVNTKHALGYNDPDDEDDNKE